ncbi:haloalkane dehalogenase [Sorangium sp. So ce406]|uniref:haloalkane dehalogenase n=1 Tax=Sorangium sp. So ce406 TaxID=3133311 RepID=UPI003F5C6733
MIIQSEKKRARVNGHTIAYVDRGAGEPMVFLHGNPTSSFLWRNVIAPLSEGFRCVAPDLIGMGDSDKLAPSGPDAYTFFQHRQFLDGFLEELAPGRRLILVVHDWGSALGFDWARRHPERVRGVAYMEAIVGAMTWDGWPPSARALFERLRSPEGERLVLEENVFVERILPSSVLRGLTEPELDEYRRPYRTPGESRRPTLSWPRQLPIEGHPPAVCAEVQKYAGWLATTPVPKLFINAEPGRILIGALRDACRRWPNQREVTVRGAHYVQEDSPGEIAQAIGDWAPTLPS